MKKFIFSIIFITLFCISTKVTYASDLNLLIDNLGIEEYGTIIDKSIPYNDFSFSNFLKDFLNGEFSNLSVVEISEYIINLIFKNININTLIIKNIILIALLSSLLSVLTENFQNKGVSEIGFYTCYIVISIMLINSFNIAISILSETISTISSIITATIPMITGILVVSGDIGSSAIFSSIILASMSFLAFFIEYVFNPLITGAVILNIVNHITPKELLTKMTDFLKWLITSLLKTIAVIFGSVVSLQSVASPVLNATASKTAKTFVSLIPVVGDAMNVAIDGMMYFVGILKSGIVVGIFISLVLCALVPIIELVVFIFFYKITAVIIEPISDSRITSCIYNLGEYTKIILSALTIFLFLFIFFIVVILTVAT